VLAEISSGIVLGKTADVVRFTAFDSEEVALTEMYDDFSEDSIDDIVFVDKISAAFDVSEFFISEELVASFIIVVTIAGTEELSTVLVAAGEEI
jgi:hypothetical protein